MEETPWAARFGVEWGGREALRTTWRVVTKRHTLDFANCWLLVAGDCLFDSVNTTDQSCFLSIREEKVQVEFKQ